MLLGEMANVNCVVLSINQSIDWLISFFELNSQLSGLFDVDGESF